MSHGKEKAKIVAIDSQALVWGVRKKGSKEKLRRAAWLFETLEEEGAQILVPAVAVSEYLTPLHIKKHTGALAILTKRFIVPPFDVRCASLAAELFSHGKSHRKMDKEDSRKCLRADSLIVATAAVHGAQVFYSDDKKCRNLAKRVPWLQVEELPSIPPHLFTESD